MVLSSVPGWSPITTTVKIGLNVGQAVVDSFNSMSYDETLGPRDDVFIQALELAFYTSIATDEGRPLLPRFVLTQSEATVNWPVDCRFSPVVPIGTVADLSKLSPLITRDHSALWLSGDEQGNLQCNGVIDCSDAGTFRFGRLAEIPVWGPDHGGSVDRKIFPDIKVVAPGWLRIDLEVAEFEYRNGSLSSKRSYLEVPGCQAAFMSLERWFRTELLKNSLLPSVEAHVLQINDVTTFSGIRALWSEVLRTLINRRHGATIIVLPEMKDGSVWPLDHGFRPHGISFRERILAVDMASVCNDRTEALNNLVWRWSAKKRQLFSTVETVAAFGNLDGCVVLDHHLNVVSFGTKLSANRELLPLVDYHDRARSLEDGMQSLGTRNNSACRFCQSVPGAVAFVISQDGDLRVYVSNEQEAYAFDRLSA